MWITAAGFFLSIIVHISTLLGFDMALITLTRVLHYGILSCLPLFVISGRVSRVYGKKGFVEAVKRHCPKWMLITIGFLIIYSIVTAFIQIVRQVYPMILLTAFMMAGYAGASACYYSYNRLKRSEK
jgi:MFS family permease